MQPAQQACFYRYYKVFLHLIYFSGISMFFALFRPSISEASPFCRVFIHLQNHLVVSNNELVCFEGLEEKDELLNE